MFRALVNVNVASMKAEISRCRFRKARDFRLFFFTTTERAN